ncbi:MAG: ATP-binding protein [Phenylobacterium sp.]|uniref:ATP-binding protein n=1 Tax=Phenylobacterium sp. TaxID=1871053 RepID=UPI00273738D8|nr:ATP-binding protein [Phenylobacterium sp.]MDP1641487.1 ATP-binding protein [Phenylobacterium sp.]MDP3117611.1 ATP-binding protein [Phenylobacterium sp.]
MSTESPPAPRWVDVARFRKRDARVILPLTLLAAIGSLLWLPFAFSAAWFVTNFVLQLFNQLLCRRLLAVPAPGPSAEQGLAAFTLIETLGYGAMPLALLMTGDQTAAVAAMAMIGAVALSGAAELPASRLISGAALTTVGAMALAGLLLSPAATPWPAVAVAAIAVGAMFAYVLEAALHREAIEGALAEALDRARDGERAAETANAAKSAFLATMSHEIRTPLNGVLGMSQVMSRDTLSAPQRERLEVIRQSGEALTALLNNVLDLSKIEAGQMEVESIPFDLNEILESARATFATLALDKGLQLEMAVDDSARGVFQGDPTRLRQVLFNLLSNAVKFTDEGRVILGAEAVSGRLKLWVSDTGPGMSQAELGRLFVRFAQLDSSTPRRHGGTGLGLAISHELCGLMGGALEATSAPGQGSTFSLSAPLVRLGDAAPAPNDGPAPPAGGLNGLRVLAAEDNEVNQVVLKALLAPLGVEPVMVADGAAAVAAWEAGEWDLVLMDVRMPVMDGLAATAAIRARERSQGRRRTPIIGLSADAMDHQVNELLAAGMDSHVSKPIDVTRLYGVLEAAL